MSNGYPEPTTPLGKQGDVIYQQGFETYEQKHFDQAQPLIENSLAIYREAQHMPGVLRALHLLGNIAFELSQYATARRVHLEVLEMCRAANIMVGVASSLNNLALVAEKEEKFTESYAYLEESIRVYEELGDETGATAARANLISMQERQIGKSEPP